MRARFEEIARLEVLNNGKAISQAKGELTQAIEDFEFFAGAATKITGSTIPVRRAASSTTRCASRSASAPRSCPGTTRS